MWFSVLGPLEVRDDDALVPLGGPRQRSVLALLLIEAPHPVTGDRLVTEIWGDASADGARDSLYTYVSNLRRALGADRVVRSGGGYGLRLRAGDAIDARDFEARLIAARLALGSDPDSAVALASDALRLWRGTPYEGLDLPSVAPEAARLQEIRLRGLGDRVEAQLRAGRVPAVDEVQAMTTAHPYHERFWELLARALYRAGRQADALASLSRLRRLLADDLGIRPTAAIGRLEERILLQDPTLDATTPGTALPLPLGDLVGRADELAELQRRVPDTRLLTIIGPGGAGKTRLAIEAVRRLGGSFPDGIWLVDLARAPGPDGVVEAVAETVGVATPPAVRDDVLATWARPRRALLVLDNCEHVAGEVAGVAGRLLAAAAGLRVLATSRRPLELAGEEVFILAGLPTADAPGVQGDAERLFSQRAAAVRPGLTLDAKSREAVTEICRHLDGLPLAIELAAARADALSPSEILGHLGDRFRLLTAPHPDRLVHASLRTSLEWSRDLLDPDVRSAFDALGVFDGRFSTRSAAPVLGVPPLRATEVLRTLVATSLLRVEVGDVSYYRMTETVRLFARDQLRPAGTWTDVLRRHDAALGASCRDLRDDLFGRDASSARAAVVAEITDHEAAFDRALADRRPVDALAMAWALGNSWLFSGALAAGVERLERVLAATAKTRTAERADALAVGAFLLVYVQRYADAAAWSGEAVEIHRTTGDDRGLAYALARRGHAALLSGDSAGAIAALRESLETCERIGDDDGRAWPVTLLAQARLWGGDGGDEVRTMFAEGRRRFLGMGDTYGQIHATTFLANLLPPADRGRYFREALTLAEMPGTDPLIRPLALHNFAFYVWNQGDRERAREVNRLLGRSALELGATVYSAMAFLQGAHFAGVVGEPERAAVLRGAGDRHFTTRLAPFWAEQLQPGVDAAARALGEGVYESLHSRGRGMSVREATAFLLDRGRTVPGQAIG